MKTHSKKHTVQNTEYREQVQGTKHTTWSTTNKTQTHRRKVWSHHVTFTVCIICLPENCLQYCYIFQRILIDNLNDVNTRLGEKGITIRITIHWSAIWTEVLYTWTNHTHLGLLNFITPNSCCFIEIEKSLTLPFSNSNYN